MTSKELLIRNHWHVMALLKQALEAPRKDDTEDDE